nr:MFS transporter [Roseivivax sp. THAF30]
MPSPATSPLWILYPVLLVTFSPLGIDLLLPAANAITRAFDRTPDRAGLLLSVFLLPLGLGQIPFGRLSDRIGRRPVALIGLALFGAGAVLGMTAPSWSVLLMGRGLQGIGASATTVVAFSAVRDRSVAGGAGGFAVLTAVLNAATALSPVLSLAPLMLFGWRAVFGLYVLLAFLALTVIRGMPDTARSAGSVLPVRAILVEQKAWLPAAITIFAMIYMMGHVAIAPAVLMGRLGVSEPVFGALFALNAVVVVLASATVSPLSSRVSATNLARIGLALFAVSGIWLSIASLGEGMTTPMPYVGAIALGSVGFTYAFGPGQGLAMAPFADAAGSASGVLGALQLAIASIGTAALSAGGATVGSFGVLVLTFSIVLGTISLFEGRRAH